jgi:hypothetical protein
VSGEEDIRDAPERFFQGGREPFFVIVQELTLVALQESVVGLSFWTRFGELESESTGVTTVTVAIACEDLTLPLEQKTS